MEDKFVCPMMINLPKPYCIGKDCAWFSKLFNSCVMMAITTILWAEKQNFTLKAGVSRESEGTE